MTYSIVARCQETGRIGAAVASHVLAAGRVLFGAAGAGVVVTQGFTLTAHGTRVLEALREGRDAATALGRSLAHDGDAHLRQVGTAAADGGVAAHTGDRCIAHAGHATGPDWAAQANVAADPAVWQVMGDTFASHDGSLERRLVAALEAGQQAGGDFRGRQSAAVLVVAPAATGDLLADRVVDVRVDNADEPLRALGRLVDLAVGAHELQRAEEALLRGDRQEAADRSREVLAAQPDSAPYLFSYAMTLTDGGAIEDAREHLRRATIAAGDDRWRVLLRRVADQGIIDGDAADAVLARWDGS